MDTIGVCLEFGGEECELDKVDPESMFFVTQIFPYCISSMGDYQLPEPNIWDNPHKLIEKVNIVHRYGNSKRKS